MSTSEQRQVVLEYLHTNKETIDAEVSFVNRHRRNRSELDRFRYDLNHLSHVSSPRAIAAFLDIGEWQVANDSDTLHSALFEGVSRARRQSGQRLPIRMTSGEVFALRDYPEVTIVQFDDDHGFGHPEELKAIVERIKDQRGFLIINRDFEEL